MMAFMTRPISFMVVRALRSNGGIHKGFQFGSIELRRQVLLQDLFFRNFDFSQIVSSGFLILLGGILALFDFFDDNLEGFVIRKGPSQIHLFVLEGGFQQAQYGNLGVVFGLVSSDIIAIDSFKQ